MAVDQHVRYIRGGRIRNAVFAGLWVVFGLAFFEKAAGIPLLLFALTSAFLIPEAWPQAMISDAAQALDRLDRSTARSSSPRSSPTPSA